MTEYDADRAMRARRRAQQQIDPYLSEYARRGAGEMVPKSVGSVTSRAVPEVPEPTTRLYQQGPMPQRWPRLRRQRPAGRSTFQP